MDLQQSYRKSAAQFVVIETCGRVVDGFFFHLDNKDKRLFRYPISLLVGKNGQVPQHNHHYFLRILKVFSIKPKSQYEWDQRKIHSKQLKLDVGCFCVGNGQCIKLKWDKMCDNLCPCMDCGGCWVQYPVASVTKNCTKCKQGISKQGGRRDTKLTVSMNGELYFISLSTQSKSF